MTATAPTTDPTRIRFDGFGWVSELAREFQSRHDVATIIRLQGLRQGVVTVKNGRLDQVSDTDSEGVGVQLFTREGDSVIGSSNEVTQDEVRALLERSLAMLRSSQGKVEGRNAEVWGLPQTNARTITPTPFGLESISYDALKDALLGHHEDMRHIDGAIPEGLSLTSTVLAIEEEWLIVRGDGSEVHWNVPRAALIDSFTVRGGGRASTTRTNHHERDLRVLLEPDRLQTYQVQARRFRQLALDLVTAPSIKAGNYKLVIDAVLAKGLAHEAFGHAAESDAIRFASILGEDEKFRTGLQICKPTVSIVDTSIEGDWAFAPYSANGLVREPVRIVDKGVLKASLADAWSAREIGVSATGASRLDSYGDVPIPRMSNICLEISDALPWHDPLDEDPAKLHAYLLEKGLMAADEEVLFLTGYSGGQVNPKLGDYVFNCQAIYRFKDGQTTLHQPALFSGKVLETLESIVAGIGPQKLHHLGTCGKAGQGVPSSGGGPMFSVIDRHPAIHIGGR